MLILILEMIIIKIRWEDIMGKKMIPKILIFWAMSENIIMILRPMIGLFIKSRAVNNFGMMFITYISAPTVAGLAIMFVYFQINLIYNSSMIKTKDWGYESRKIILLVIFILQFVLFVGGGLLAHFSIIKHTQGFWTPVIIVDFTIIPYFCILGIIIYRKISHMEKDNYKKLAKQILFTVIFCSALGIFTGSVGILAWQGTYNFEWVLIEACWISAILFSGFIFTMMARRKKVGSIIITQDTSKSNKVSTDSTIN
jgi:hypothetical protein